MAEELFINILPLFFSPTKFYQLFSSQIIILWDIFSYQVISTLTETIQYHRTIKNNKSIITSH